MTRSGVKKIFTTPPPPRPPSPKHPLFTADPLSTTSFGPGHLIGAGVLVLGVVGLTKWFIARGQAQAEATRRLSEQPHLARRPEDEPQIAQVENERGQYGKKP